MQRSNKREAIMQAAGRLVKQQGVQSMTLDSVAEEAGVSKGGLLYHFPSKDALVEGMLQAEIERFAEDIRAAGELEPEQSGSFVRAYVQTATSHDNDMDSSLLAALVSNPQLLEPARRTYQQLYDRAAADGVDETEALIACLAADGLWLLEMFGLLRLPEHQRSRLVQRLAQMAQPST